MNCKVDLIGAKLIFSLTEEVELASFNNMKIDIGLDISKQIDSCRFYLNVVDYINRIEHVNFQIKRHDIDPQDGFKNFIMTLKSHSASVNLNLINNNELDILLKSNGFKRTLRSFQSRNVLKLLSKKYGATFSVPGAGKTSEILSTYIAFKSQYPDLKLLVVGPKNAFTAWDEEIPDCIDGFSNINAHIKDLKSQNYAGRMVRLTGGISNIKNLLLQSPDCCIISYQQLSNSEEVIEVVTKYLNGNKVFCALDESHRIKGIYGSIDSPGTQARAVLTISPFCEFRYVMSGTPMPQWEGDLYNQYKFLIPLTKVDLTGVYNEIKDLYVRTNKHDLGIPEFKTEIIEVPMSSDQYELYEKIRNIEKRKYIKSSHSNKLRNLKKSVMRMLQISSNPRIINDLDFYNIVKEEGLNSLIEESSTKFKSVCELARKIAGEGEKVLIWSGFKGNIKLLLEELVDLNPVEVDGSTFSGDEEEEGTRDFNIKKFKTDPNCMVLIANPAAASEGISLHIDRDRNPLCKNAIYLDRNFNAAQFIQSVDRIHRLGITWNPNIYILKTKNSMDSRVQERLDEKIEALQKLLDDPSLSPYLSVDPTLNEEEFVLEEQSTFTISNEDQKYYENELLRD
jgi:hypothetical protein